jgi:hypothetical protein
MTDDDELATASHHDPLARVYDFFKFLTTLSLISLGGMFGLMNGKNGANINVWMIVLVVVLLGLAAITSFSALTAITTAELKKTASPQLLKQLMMSQHIASALLSVGVGAFLYAFLKVLP